MQFYIAHSESYHIIQVYYIDADDDNRIMSLATIDNGEVFIYKKKIDLKPERALLRYFVPYAKDKHDKRKLFEYCDRHLKHLKILEALGGAEALY